MSTLRLQPAGRLRGRLRVPGDKSISHRALICNALAPGEALIEGFLGSADCLSTMRCLRGLGVEIEESADSLTVRSPGRDGLQEAGAPLDCGNSGTTMRLLAGFVAPLGAITVLDGDASLRRRPMDRIAGPLRKMGVDVEGQDGGRFAPLLIRGPRERRLQPFSGTLPVASAQVKSAVLLAALAADEESRIEELGPTRDHTELLLSAMGAKIERAGAEIRLTPGKELTPRGLRVPGDISAAAFWLVAGCLAPDAELSLEGVGINPTRSGVIDVLRAMGAAIEITEERQIAGELVADLTVRSSELRGTTIEGDLVIRSIDELPVLAVAAAAAEGRTEIRDARELRVKESDRVATTVHLLRAFGVRVTEHDDGLTIEGGAVLRGGTVECAGDHRIAMAAAVAALAAEGESEIRDADAVAISYPDFWRDLATLSGSEPVMAAPN